MENRPADILTEERIFEEALPTEKRGLGRGGRLLLLLAAFVTGVLAWLALEEVYGDFWPAFVIETIYAICLGAFLVLNRETVRAKRKEPLPWIVLGATVTVMIATVFGIIDGSDFSFRFYAFFTVPAMLLLYAATIVYDVPLHEEGRLVLGAGKLLVVSSILSVPEMFRSIGMLFRRRKAAEEAPVGAAPARKRFLQVLIGLIIGIPLLIAVIALLTNADAHMGELLHGLGEWIGDIEFDLWILRLFIVFRMMLFVFPLMYGTRFRSGNAPRMREFRLPGTTLTVIGGLVLLAYGLFLGLQFSYLFGGTLPEAYTYSSYAVKGFKELIVVSAINDVLLAAMERYSDESMPLTVVKWLILTANALLVASAGLRLGMYIGAYGWTERRLLSAWLEMFIAFLTVLTGIRFVKKEIPLRRIAGAVFLIWYAVLCVVDWGALLRIKPY